MPLYEYCCEVCGSVSEFNMKMSDPHPEVCPNCSKGPLVKLLSPTAFHLKGGGWYNQAYDGKSNQKPKAAKQTKKSEKPKESKKAKETKEQ